MGDEEDGFALGLEAPHNVHQLVDFLGSQHGGRLVENQNLVVPVEHLQNLHTLLHANADVLHLGIGVHLQSVALGQLHDLLPGSGTVHHHTLHRLRAQNDVVQHREALHQLEVLVHHADVQGGGIVGVIDPDLLTILLDNSLFRLVQAEQDAHQSGLARAVLAQKGVDLAALQLERHVIIGLDAGEFLGDVQHFDDIICHELTPLQIYGKAPAGHRPQRSVPGSMFSGGIFKTRRTVALL